jgi:3,4-dihydroxy-2-butanone 4-phosphate synthase
LNSRTNEIVCQEAPAPVEEAIAAIARGEIVVVTDDDDREDEGDLVMAADHVTPEAVTFMITRGRGLVCLAVTGADAHALALPPMVEHNEDHLGTAFTVSIDGTPATGVTTGISARDRAETIRRAVSGKRDELQRPGHVFPLVAVPGGVLERRGHTEAAVDLARCAGRIPMGVIVEIIRDDGEMLRGEALERFADDHGLVKTSIDALSLHLQEDVARGDR